MNMASKMKMERLYRKQNLKKYVLDKGIFFNYDENLRKCTDK